MRPRFRASGGGAKAGHPATIQTQRIGKTASTILIEVFHVGMGRSAVQVVITLLYIFPMIAFLPVQSEEWFFQDGIFPIPESYRKTDLLVSVANAGNPIFVPAICT